MPAARPHATGAVRRVVAVAALLTALTGCSLGPGDSPPTGIDGLDVPSASPVATDQDGHVWWFGREGEWQVGPGVPLGLWLPAEPRVGDGWRRSAAEGVSEERVTVLETGEQVVLEVRSDLDPTLVRREVFVDGALATTG